MASKDLTTLLSNIDWKSLVDFDQQSLLISLAAIAFNPTAWNIVARNGASGHALRGGYGRRVTRLLGRMRRGADSVFFSEYRNKTITRLFGGNARYGCYFLAFMIFSFGMIRDQL